MIQFAPIGMWLGKRVGHLLIYMLILGAIFGTYFATYQYGWRKGYSQCAKDRPTYGNVGTVYECPEEYRWFGLRVNIWKFKTGLGL